MSIYDTLNPPQQEAVFHTEGPLLILAGAGSGKTRVLTHRIAHLIADKGVNPFNILAITFTNKAAQEMRERVDKLTGADGMSVWVATFHSTCVRILRRNGLDFDAVDTTPGVAALDIPILFFHGDADTFVPLHHSERNLAACRREQLLIVIPGAEHAMAAQVDPERYRRELLVFLWRNTNYLWAERNKPLR